MTAATLPEKDISVIICTFNRARSLQRTLESATAMEVPDGVAWELLILDNNSADDTRAICEQFAERVPMRYVFEPRQGKSNALNTALQNVRGKLLLFTDDDVVIDRGWIAGFYDSARRHPEIAFFSGKILPVFDAPPPRWFRDHTETLLANLVLFVDRGPAELPMDLAAGANMAVRAEALRGITFRPDLGPDGTDTIRAEETELFRSLVDRGCRGLYVPSALVHHCLPGRRLNERYVCKWSYGEGLGRARRGHIDMGSLLFGAPRYLWREFLANAFVYLLARPFGPSKAWLRAEMNAAIALGCISEFRNARTTPTTP